MHIWALSDFHLSFGVKNKSMEKFGDTWKDWTQKIEKNCHAVIKEEDLLIIAGDLSWATTLEEALIDLKWIDSLPGKKIIIKGNHDYWWSSYKKLQEALPPSIFAIQNNALNFGEVSICGTRLWDSEEFSFNSIIKSESCSFGKEEIKELQQEDKKIFDRELLRLEMSLKELNQEAKYKIAITHYPPIGIELKDSKVSKLLEKYKVDIALFGHLHSLKKGPFFGKKGNISYFLTSTDYLNHTPIQIL